MDWPTVIASIALAVIVAASVGYLIRQKLKGRICIGCPLGSQCTRMLKISSAHSAGDKGGKNGNSHASSERPNRRPAREGCPYCS